MYISRYCTCEKISYDKFRRHSRCPDHGDASKWYNSPERKKAKKNILAQVALRKAEISRLEKELEVFSVYYDNWRGSYRDERTTKRFKDSKLVKKAKTKKT